MGEEIDYIKIGVGIFMTTLLGGLGVLRWVGKRQVERIDKIEDSYAKAVDIVDLHNKVDRHYESTIRDINESRKEVLARLDMVIGANQNGRS